MEKRVDSYRYPFQENPSDRIEKEVAGKRQNNFCLRFSAEKTPESMILEVFLRSAYRIHQNNAQ